MIDIIIIFFAIICIIIGIIKYVKDLKLKKSGCNNSKCYGCEFSDNCRNEENKKVNDHTTNKN